MDEYTEGFQLVKAIGNNQLVLSFGSQFANDNCFAPQVISSEKLSIMGQQGYLLYSDNSGTSSNVYNIFLNSKFV